MAVLALVPCRLMVDPPAAGDWNMAVDEALLQSASQSQHGTLRFYRWSAPTLSLGYFQPLADRRQHAASLNCPVVRRSSGGGALVHDLEITYSLALPTSFAPATRPERLYSAVHTELCEAIRQLYGLAPRLLETAEAAPDTPPFLCFQRRGPGDVVCGRSKVCGSAQRRRQNAVLQHGSVLLRTSSAAPELAGLEELASRSVDSLVLIQVWSERIASSLGLQLIAGALTPEEESEARQISNDRFDSPEWASRR